MVQALSVDDSETELSQKKIFTAALNKIVISSKKSVILYIKSNELF